VAVSDGPVVALGLGGVVGVVVVPPSSQEARAADRMNMTVRRRTVVIIAPVPGTPIERA
jgi:hypothetical protein